MVKKIQFIFFFFACFGFSQKNPMWKGYFSYNQTKDLSESSSFIFSASENALFYKNINNEDIGTINSVDGLKTDIISSIFHSETKNITFVGNQNGLLLLIKSDGTIIQKRGIIDEIPLSPLIKKINHFFEYQDKIYISCDYGISVFDLNTYEFADTYMIGNNGQPVVVYQTTVLNNELYAVTNSIGIKKIALTNPNLIDFNQWQTFDSASWKGITTIQNQLIAMNSDNKIYKHNGTGFDFLINLNQTGLDIRSYNNHLIVTSANNVFIFNSSLQQVAHILSSQVTDFSATFSCATLINDVIYIGTNENGIVSTTLSNPTSFEVIMPDGPIKNSIFRTAKSSKALWVLYGSYSKDYNPYNPGLGEYPISKYSKNGWDIIPYSDLFGAKSLSNITFNPNNENIFYVSSFFSGLLKIENETPTILYNQSNTSSNGLETLVIPGNPTYGPDVRINGPTFDKNGNLWMTNSLVSKGLKVLKNNNQWQSYDMSSVFSNAIAENYSLLVVDKNNTKWLPTNHSGLIAFNETLNNKSIVIYTETSGNLPDRSVRCLAIDKKNQLWIGTNRGLRIIQSVDQFLTSTEIQTKAIIINEVIDGEALAQELFYDQFIYDISVDGANRKWVSVADGGVFLVSSNGQQTIYHFTKENSPLPSNNVNDIEIDGATGEVFFATDKGMVSFKGISTDASDDLKNVFIYPNPVRPEYSGTVKISGLTNKAIVKITDIEGNLVFETTSEGGTIEWNTTAFDKYKVASGVYMVLISAEDGIETTVKKIMIIR